MRLRYTGTDEVTIETFNPHSGESMWTAARPGDEYEFTDDQAGARLAGGQWEPASKADEKLAAKLDHVPVGARQPDPSAAEQVHAALAAGELSEDDAAAALDALNRGEVPAPDGAPRAETGASPAAADPAPGTNEAGAPAQEG